MKKGILFLVFFVLSAFTVLAHGEQTFTDAENIIKAKTDCSELTDDQLEDIGDYYMEQMHPGDAHENMDDMMGGEGSENLKQAHINMARSFYCGEHGNMSADMMGMMVGRGGTGMMDSGMMGKGMMHSSMWGKTRGEGKMAYGMMGSGVGMVGAWLLGLLYFALASFVFALIFWYTYRLVASKEEKKTHKKR